MKYIISGTDFKQVDKYTIDTVGIPSLVLMERAAFSVAEEILSFATKADRIAVVCGTGNNGADGVAVARILCCKGYSTCVYILGNRERGTEEFRLQLSIYEKIGGNIIQTDKAPTGAISSEVFGNSKRSVNVDFKEQIIVDAIFGVGLSRAVEGMYKEVIESINCADATVVSVDVPSGIHADNGMVMGVGVKADITVTFGRNKTGMVFYPGADYVGKVKVKDIGFPEISFSQVPAYQCISEEDYALIPARSNSSNKGTYGKVLVVAGNDSMSGAAFLCAKAALRMGCGMVKIFTTKGNEALLKSMLPEAMLTVYEEDDYAGKLAADLAWCDVVAAGPGMGTGILQSEIIAAVLDAGCPCVMDADGINCISADRKLKKKLHEKVILTPHVGEMARFSGMKIKEISGNSISVAKGQALEYGITIVLKDARTVISDGKEVFINVSGNNGMSTAGSGDVLAGITGSPFGKGNGDGSLWSNGSFPAWNGRRFSCREKVQNITDSNGYD